MKAITALTLRAAEKLKFHAESCKIEMHIAEPAGETDADDRVLVTAEGTVTARCTDDPRWVLVFNWKAGAKELSNEGQALGVYDYAIEHSELTPDEREIDLLGVHIWGECERIDSALEAAVDAMDKAWKFVVADALSRSEPVFTAWADEPADDCDIPWLQDY